MSHDATRTEGIPHDRLTRICDAMTTAMDVHPEVHEEDKAIVFLDDGKMAGMVLHGYTDDVDAIADLLMHLQALFEANGKRLMVATIGGEN